MFRCYRDVMKRFNVSIPHDLVTKLDRAAATELISRSEYIR